MSAIDSPCPQRLDELTCLVTQLLQQPPNLNTVVGLRTKAKQQLSGFLSHPRQSRLWIDAENALAWLAAQGHSVI